jgi:hypothetical protein
MLNDQHAPTDRYKDRHKGWAASAAIIGTSLLIAGVFLHTWTVERMRAASATQVSASLEPPAEAAPAR